MKTLVAVLLFLYTGLAWAGPGTSGGTPGSLTKFTFSTDHRKVLFGDVLFDGGTGEPIGRPMDEIGTGGSALSPDGRLAVSFRYLTNTAPPDSYATIWNVNTGLRLADLAQGEPLAEVQFTPDGKKILTVSPSHVRVWDGATGSALAELPLRSPHEGYTMYAGSVEVTADSHFAVVNGGKDDGIAVFDLGNYEQLSNQTLFGSAYEGGGDASKLIPGTDLIAIHRYPSPQSTPEIQVYDLARKTLLYRVGQNAAEEISFSDDGRILITREELGRELNYWDSRTGALIRKVNISSIPLDYFYHVFVEASDNGQQLRLLVVDEQHDYKEVEYSLNVTTGQLHDLHYSDQSWGMGLFDGYYVTVEKWWTGMEASLHSFDDGRIVRVFKPPYYGRILRTKDGSLLVPTPPDEGSPWLPIQVFDSSTGLKVRTLRGDVGTSTKAVAISSQGRFLLSSSMASDGSVPPAVHLWNLRAAQELRRIDDESAIGFSSDESVLVTMSKDHAELHVWKAETGEPLRTIVTPGYIQWATFRETSSDLLIAVHEFSGSYDWLLESYDASTGAEKFRQKTRAWTNLLNVSEDGKRVATSSSSAYNSALEVWDSQTGKVLFSQNVSRQDCRLSSDGSRLYCADLLGITAWAVDQQKVVAQKNFDQPLRNEVAPQLAPEGDLLGLYTSIWRTDTLEPACESHLSYIQFLGQDQILESANGGRDFNVRDCTSSSVSKSYRFY